MALKSLNISPLEIPFKTGFKHHSAERRKTQSVLVRAESLNGAVGLGESCPREYVTHEDVSSCMEFFSRHRDEISIVENPGDLSHWVESHETLVDKNPAAWCAMELAMLDLLSKERSQSVEKTLGVPELEGVFTYTAVLGDSSADIFLSQAKRYLALGFSDFKLKISGDPAMDGEKIKFLHAEAAVPIRLRLDANNLWQSAPEAVGYLKALPSLPFAIEEPLKAFDTNGLKEIAGKIPVKIILDESALCLRHLDALQGCEKNFIVNLRVSKMGGLIRSLKFAEQSQRIGFPLIVGAQVGETSILTRAALTVANTNRTNLLAQEGAYGTLLLESDITPTPLMFGKGGSLDPRDFMQADCFGFQIPYFK